MIEKKQELSIKNKLNLIQYEVIVFNILHKAVRRPGLGSFPETHQVRFLNTARLVWRNW
jgi:hypothetical protein